MNPGKLKDEITLQTPAIVIGDNGETLNVYSEYDTILANVSTPSVRSFRSGSDEEQGTQGTVRINKWLVQVRYDDDISTAMRVVWGNHIFDIQGITADKDNWDYMFLHCTETRAEHKTYGEAATATSMAITIDGTTYTDGDTYSTTTAIDNDKTITVTLTNSGDASLEIGADISGDTEFSLSATGKLIKTDDSDTLTVTYSASGEANTASTTLTIQTNDPAAAEVSLTITVEES